MVRVIRIMPADSAVPRMTLGMMRNPRFPSGSSIRDVYCIGGAQPHQIEGKIMTMMPSQKLGVAMPMTAMVRPA